MSVARSVLTLNVRELLRDLDPGARVVPSERIWRALEATAQAWGVDVWQGPAWVTGAITVVAGTSDYTLPGSVEYAQVLELRRQSDGHLLSRRTQEQMELLRENTSNTPSPPTDFALWELTTQVVNVRVYPTGANVLDLLRSLIPGALSSDAATVPFNAPLARGLERFVAAEIAASQMARLQISEEAIKGWYDSAARALQKEKERVSAMKSVPHMALMEGW